MLNWYEEEIRRTEIERELAQQHRISEALDGRPASSRRVNRTLAWLGRGLVAVGWRLQQGRGEER